MADNILKTRIQLRNDTAENWTTHNPVLLVGEVGIERDTNKFKIGDGAKTWSALPYAGAQIKIEGEGEVITGAVLTSAGELVLTKGKLNLENVYLTEGLTYTADIGVKKVPTSGSGTIGKAGDSLKTFLSSILAEAKDPKVTQPSVSIRLSDAGEKEVGSTVSSAYTISFNKGSYQYGPETGITATYVVTDGTSTKPSTSTTIGQFDNVTVTDTTNYKVTVTATHTEGAVPKNNLGIEVPSKKIAAGEKTASSSSITGYRNSFYGSVLSKEGVPTSATIRELTKSNKALVAGDTFDAVEIDKAMRVIIAVPAPRTINSIKDVNGLNAEAFSAFTHITVDVKGANGYEAKTYNVYYKDNAVANNKVNKWHCTVA